MTNLYNALTVVLDHDIRDDDAEPVLNAIRMIKGVQSVVGEVADTSKHVATIRVRQEICNKLFEILRNETD